MELSVGVQLLLWAIEDAEQYSLWRALETDGVEDGLQLTGSHLCGILASLDAKKQTLDAINSSPERSNYAVPSGASLSYEQMRALTLGEIDKRLDTGLRNHGDFESASQLWLRLRTPLCIEFDRTATKQKLDVDVIWKLMRDVAREHGLDPVSIQLSEYLLEPGNGVACTRNGCGTYELARAQELARQLLASQSSADERVNLSFSAVERDAIRLWKSVRYWLKESGDSFGCWMPDGTLMQDRTALAKAIAQAVKRAEDYAVAENVVRQALRLPKADLAALNLDGAAFTSATAALDGGYQDLTWDELQQMPDAEFQQMQLDFEQPSKAVLETFAEIQAALRRIPKQANRAVAQANKVQSSVWHYPQFESGVHLRFRFSTPVVIETKGSANARLNGRTVTLSIASPEGNLGPSNSTDPSKDQAKPTGVRFELPLGISVSNVAVNLDGGTIRGVSAVRLGDRNTVDIDENQEIEVLRSLGLYGIFRISNTKYRVNDLDDIELHYTAEIPGVLNKYNSVYRIRSGKLQNSQHMREGSNPPPFWNLSGDGRKSGVLDIAESEINNAIATGTLSFQRPNINLDRFSHWGKYGPVLSGHCHSLALDFKWPVVVSLTEVGEWQVTPLPPPPNVSNRCSALIAAVFAESSDGMKGLDRLGGPSCRTELLQLLAEDNRIIVGFRLPGQAVGSEPTQIAFDLADGGLVDSTGIRNDIRSQISRLLSPSVPPELSDRLEDVKALLKKHFAAFASVLNGTVSSDIMVHELPGKLLIVMDIESSADGAAIIQGVEVDVPWDGSKLGKVADVDFGSCNIEADFLEALSFFKAGNGFLTVHSPQISRTGISFQVGSRLLAFLGKNEAEAVPCGRLLLTANGVEIGDLRETVGTALNSASAKALDQALGGSGEGFKVEWAEAAKSGDPLAVKKVFFIDRTTKLEIEVYPSVANGLKAKVTQELADTIRRASNQTVDNLQARLRGALELKIKEFSQNINTVFGNTETGIQVEFDEDELSRVVSAHEHVELSFSVAWLVAGETVGIRNLKLTSGVEFDVVKATVNVDDLNIEYGSGELIGADRFLELFEKLGLGENVSLSNPRFASEGIVVDVTLKEIPALSVSNLPLGSATFSMKGGLSFDGEGDEIIKAAIVKRIQAELTPYLKNLDIPDAGPIQGLEILVGLNDDGPGPKIWKWSLSLSVKGHVNISVGKNDIAIPLVYKILPEPDLAFDLQSADVQRLLAEAALNQLPAMFPRLPGGVEIKPITTAPYGASLSIKGKWGAADVVVNKLEITTEGVKMPHRVSIKFNTPILFGSFCMTGPEIGLIWKDRRAPGRLDISVGTDVTFVEPTMANVAKMPCIFTMDGNTPLLISSNGTVVLLNSLTIFEITGKMDLRPSSLEADLSASTVGVFRTVLSSDSTLYARASHPPEANAHSRIGILGLELTECDVDFSFAEQRLDARSTSRLPFTEAILTVKIPFSMRNATANGAVDFGISKFRVNGDVSITSAYTFLALKGKVAGTSLGALSIQTPNITTMSPARILAELNKLFGMLNARDLAKVLESVINGTLTLGPGSPGGPPSTPGGPPSGDKPSGDKPSGDKPSGDKPSGDKPSGDKPSGDKPSGDKPSQEDSETETDRRYNGPPGQFGYAWFDDPDGEKTLKSFKGKKNVENATGYYSHTSSQAVRDEVDKYLASPFAWVHYFGYLPVANSMASEHVPHFLVLDEKGDFYRIVGPTQKELESFYSENGSLATKIAPGYFKSFQSAWIRADGAERRTLYNSAIKASEEDSPPLLLPGEWQLLEWICHDDRAVEVINESLVKLDAEENFPVGAILKRVTKQPSGDATSQWVFIEFATGKQTTVEATTDSIRKGEQLVLRLESRASELKKMATQNGLYCEWREPGSKDWSCGFISYDSEKIQRPADQHRDELLKIRGSSKTKAEIGEICCTRQPALVKVLANISANTKVRDPLLVELVRSQKTSLNSGCLLRDASGAIYFMSTEGDSETIAPKQSLPEDCESVLDLDSKALSSKLPLMELCRAACLESELGWSVEITKTHIRGQHLDGTRWNIQSLVTGTDVSPGRIEEVSANPTPGDLFGFVWSIKTDANTPSVFGYLDPQKSAEQLIATSSRLKGNGVEEGLAITPIVRRLATTAALFEFNGGLVRRLSGSVFADPGLLLLAVPKDRSTAFVVSLPRSEGIYVAKVIYWNRKMDIVLAKEASAETTMWEGVNISSLDAESRVPTNQFLRRKVLHLNRELSQWLSEKNNELTALKDEHAKEANKDKQAALAATIATLSKQIKDEEQERRSLIETTANAVDDLVGEEVFATRILAALEKTPGAHLYFGEDEGLRRCAVLSPFTQMQPDNLHFFEQFFSTKDGEPRPQVFVRNLDKPQVIQLKDRFSAWVTPPNDSQFPFVIDPPYKKLDSSEAWDWFSQALVKTNLQWSGNFRRSPRELLIEPRKANSN
ncbi:hypothetical protein U8335_20545 [Roseiconus lacunae]|uniref:hypothetical protein n=1 Tax=Roseiconus lacunae TaxID=2605694 RepID=UPI00308C5A13|nr:hypothetical protein U8335_20545 [Stieleria sp. HD01]